MGDKITYLHLEPGSTLPGITVEPTRMVVIVAAEVTPGWRSLVSDWIVRSGCLYMMAWGIDCSSWDDEVDWANIDAYGDGEIPEAGFVMTTWHAGMPLEDALWYSKNLATHPVVDLHRTVILDISTVSRSDELLKAYAEA